MIDNINAEPDYGDEPPFACLFVAVHDGEAFACGGTPGHAGKHRYLIEWDGQGDLAAQDARPAPGDAFACPDCGSPEPRLHPAVSGGGEVTRVCQHPFHDGKSALDWTRQQPQPELAAAKPELGTAWRLLDEARAKLAALREQLAGLATEMHARAEAPVPPGSVDLADRIVRAQVLHEYAARIRQLLGPEAS